MIDMGSGRPPAVGSVCDRCGKPARANTVSYFNTETICIRCSRRERTHPQFTEAQRIEEEAVRAGNYNFPGIGCPPELYLPDTE
jgi:hypothetical protein